jgi:hypothetical protein
VRLARVNKLVAFQIFLELLDNFNPELKVVGAMSENQFTNLLALVWALSDETTVISEKMFREEFVEFVFWRFLILIDLKGQLLAEHQRVGKGALDWRKTTKHHC